MTNQVIRNCTLEIQGERGVLYVHDSNGVTVLRMSGLPRPVQEIYEQDRRQLIPTNMLDIAITGSRYNYYPKVQFSWRGQLNYLGASFDGEAHDDAG